MSQPGDSTGNGAGYGWVVLFASFVIASIGYAGGYSFGLFFKPLQQEFGWTAAEASAVFSFYMVSYCIFGLVSGWAVDRLGPRVTTVCGGLLLGSGFLLSSRVHELWHMYVTYGLLAGAGMSAFYGPLLTTASRWFPRKQGLALGVVSSGIGTGTFLGPLIFGYLISSFGWRSSYLIGGSLIGGIVLTLGLLLKREPMQTAVSVKESRASGLTDQVASDASELTFGGLLRRRAFWLFSSIYFLVGFGLQMMIAHVVPYVQAAYRFSPSAAGAVLSTMGVASVAGRLALGAASDSMGSKRALALSVSLEGIAIIFLLLSTHPWMLHAFAALFGFAYGGHAPQFPALVRQLFGIRQLGRNIGLEQVFYGLGAFFGPFLAGCVVDATGSYRLAFAMAAVALILGALVSLGLKVPAIRENVPPVQSSLASSSPRACPSGKV